MTLTAGTRLGPYEIVSPIGAGGMGEVYRARDTRLSRDVAVKVLPEPVAEDDDRLTRFQRESRAVAALSHPNIVAIYDVGREGTIAFSVLELLEGETLGLRLARGPLPWRDALEVAVPIADGLAAAHEKGIVHRDLKPANVVLTRDGRVKILDFGIARRLPAASTERETSDPTQGGELTQPGVLIGTLSYLSPEQARGANVDGRSDVFSFGALLYEMLTGRRAFLEGTGTEILVSILRDDPPRPADLGVDLPADVDAILFRCLRKDPAERFQSASDLSFALRMVGRSGEGSRATAAPAPAGPPAVAVLPFSNLSPDPESEYFSDGITEELIHALARVRGLRVAARTSSFAFKDRHEDARTIGKRLGVTALLEGSVRKAGDRLRITAQLINVADGYHLWSDTFDRRMSDVFAIQEEIAQAIVSRFKVQFGLDQPVARGHSRDPEAYNLYLKGRYFWNRRSQEASRAAIALFERAIERDPAYALAHAMLADCYILRQEPNVPHREHLSQARKASQKALDLDEGVAQAHSSMARVRLYLDWDWAGADAGFRRALELEPSYTEAHHIYSHFLLPAGRVEESLAQSRIALELEPDEVAMTAHLGWHHFYAGQWDLAIPQSRAALAIDPRFLPAHMHLGMALEQKGLLDEALVQFQEAAEISSSGPEARGGLGHLLGAMGRSDEARDILREMSRPGGPVMPSSFQEAVVCAGLGERDSAMERLEAAAEERSPEILEIQIDPRLAPLRGEPRFTALARRIGLPETQSPA